MDSNRSKLRGNLFDYTTTMTKILVAGGIVAENQFFIKKIPQANQVALTNELVKSDITSKVINAGRILAQQHQVSFLGQVGQDQLGKQARERLEQFNFNLDYVSQSAAATDQVVVLTNDQGESAITVFQGASLSLAPLAKSAYSDFAGLFLATSLPLKFLYQVLADFKQQAGGPVLLDFPNKQQEFALRHCRFIDFLTPNRQEAELLTGKAITSIKQAIQAAQVLLKFGPQNVIITLDNQGCVLVNQQLKKHFPAEKVTAVDSTGAGDIFRGVFFAEYLKTNQVMTSVQKAVKLASHSVGIKGVNASIKETHTKLE